MNAPHTSESGDDALDAIDQMMMLLMAAVDVTARVGYRVLRVPLSRCGDRCAAVSTSRARISVDGRDTILGCVRGYGSGASGKPGLPQRSSAR